MFSFASFPKRIEGFVERFMNFAPKKWQWFKAAGSNQNLRPKSRVTPVDLTKNEYYFFW